MLLTEIHEILKTNYSIFNAELKQLDGYESLNYRVLTEYGKKYVLKIHRNAFEGLEILHAENEILTLLGKEMSGYFAKPIEDDQGELISEIGNGNYARLITYLEGKFLAEISINKDHLIQLGKKLAQIDKSLSSYYNPWLASRVLKWDLQHCLSRKEYSAYIKNSKQKSKADYFFMMYREKIQPIQHRLRKGTIHGDANDWNILEQDGRISGFIDFGDMAYSPIINELAIAIPYAIFGSKTPVEDTALIVASYHKIYPLEEQEIEILYYLVGARLAVSVSHSAYFNKDKEASYISISEKPAWDLIDVLLAVNPVHFANELKNACGFSTEENINIEEELKVRHQYLSKSMSVSYQTPIKMSGAAFQYMYAADGTCYLDAYNNIPLVGHCHPKVVEAGQQQMAALNTNTRYIYDQLHEYAELLLSKFLKELNKVFFVNSGSAGSDLAIRMARAYSDGKHIAILEHGYHGNTEIGIDISSYKFDRKGGKGASENIVKLPMPDEYRGKYKRDNPNRGMLYAKEAIEILEHNEKDIAGFIAEPIMGCGGQVILPEGYLKEMYSYIRRKVGLCIADEVQIGFSRVGTHFWGFEQHGVVPDIVVLGKPMGNGHPMGAVVCTDEVALAFENGMEFFSSFGGNPVSCAIGKAVLEVIKEEGLQQNSLEIGNYIMNELNEFKNEFAIIGDVRGSGLFWGMEMIHPNSMKHHTEAARELKNFLRNQNILISTDGPFDNVLKSKPPLCFNQSNADQLLKEIHSWLKSNT